MKAAGRASLKVAAGEGRQEKLKESVFLYDKPSGRSRCQGCEVSGLLNGRLAARVKAHCFSACGGGRANTLLTNLFLFSPPTLSCVPPIINPSLPSLLLCHLLRAAVPGRTVSTCTHLPTSRPSWRSTGGTTSSSRKTWSCWRSRCSWPTP